MSTALRTYYRGDELVGLRDGQANATRYYHFDHQGTTQCLTDKTGAVTDRFTSDAWGVEVKRTGNSINRQWYVGNWGYDRDSEFTTYIRERYLTSQAGRFASRDRVPSRLPYWYVENNPALFVDPSGLVARISDCSDGDTQNIQDCLRFNCTTIANLTLPGILSDVAACMRKGGCQPRPDTLARLTNLCPDGDTQLSINCRDFNAKCQERQCCAVENNCGCGGMIGAGCYITLCKNNMYMQKCAAVNLNSGHNFCDLLFHEMLHCAGFPPDGGGAYPSCNDIMVCCINSVLYGLPDELCKRPN